MIHIVLLNDINSNINYIINYIIFYTKANIIIKFFLINIYKK